MTYEIENSNEDENLAAEYVLGLLEGEELSLAESRAMTDFHFRKHIIFWQEQMAPFANNLIETPPPDYLKNKVMGRLFKSEKKGIREYLSQFWIPLVGGAALLVAAALFIPSMMNTPLGEPQYQVTLLNAKTSLQLSAVYSEGASSLSISLDEGDIKEQRDFELWLIPKDAPAPISLGVISSKEMQISLTQENINSLKTASLALSDEPKGGSPTGAPTGEILAIAPIETL